MKKITLGPKIVISDPAYEIPTLAPCQAILKILPGEYLTKVQTVKRTINTLIVVHKKYLKSDLNFGLTTSPICADSGQVGIFDYDSYRNDAHIVKAPKVKFTYPKRKPGDKWYESVSKFTMSDRGWGTYDRGVISTSGHGDGVYDLYLAQVSGTIVAVAIDFKTADLNLNFYKQKRRKRLVSGK